MTKAKLFSAMLSLILGSGCAMTSRYLITPKNLNESQVEITYILGHSHYKYVAVAGKEDAEVSSYRDDRVLEKRSIPLSRYQDYVAKIEEALQSSPTGKVDEDCRTPYKIEITAGERKRTISGCRSADAEGQIGQLLKEGEFLFYSEDAAGKDEK